jgi:hypothetical protein
VRAHGRFRSDAEREQVLATVESARPFYLDGAA